MDGRNPDILDKPLRTLQEWSKSWPDWAEGAAARVQAFDPDELSTEQVVGIAVGTATTLGGLLVALGPGDGPVTQVEKKTRTRVAARRAGGNRRRDRRAPAEVDGMTVDERAILTLAEARPETIERAKVQLEQGGKAMRTQQVEVTQDGKGMTRRTRRDLRRQTDQLEKQIRILQKELDKQSKREGRKLPDTSRVREVAASAGDNVSRRVAAVGAATAAAATPLIERARNAELAGQVRGLADTTRERTVDLTGRMRDEFVPLMVERAGRVREDIVPLVAERVTRVREDVVPQVAEAATRIGQRFKEAGEGSVADLAGVRQATVAALSAPPPKKRSWVGTSIWAILITSVIGLVIYYLRDEERRQKALATAQSIAEQGREIVRDFQGYDEEF